MALTDQQRKAALDALQAWQARPATEDGKALTVESSATNGVLPVEASFARSHIDLDDQGCLFQVRLGVPNGQSLTGIHFESLHLYFTGQAAPFVIQHEDGSDAALSTLTDVGRLSLDPEVGEGGAKEEKKRVVGRADLRWWSPGVVRALQGVVLPATVGLLQLEKVCLLGKGGTDFCLEFVLAREEELRSSSYVPQRWLVAAQPARYINLPLEEEQDGVVVRKRRHRVRVDVQHEQEAYLEESFPIRLAIKNEDDVALQCALEAVVQGAAQEGSGDRLWVRGKEGESGSSSRLEEGSMGVVKPGATMEYTVLMTCQQHLRPRSVELLFKTVIPGDESESRTSEIVHTAVIPVKPLFGPAFQASWRVVKSASLAVPLAPSARKPSITVSDVDETGSSEGGGGETMLANHSDGESAHGGSTTTSLAGINVGLAVLAKEDIFIEAVSMHLSEESKHLRMAVGSGSGGGGGEEAREEKHSVSAVYQPGDRWGTVFDVVVLSENSTGFAIEGSDGTLRPTGQLVVKWRRQSASSPANEMNVSRLDVPLLAPPHLLPRIVVSVPSSTTLEQPLVMLLSIVNPSKLSSEIFVSIDDAHADFGILSHKTFTVPLMAKSTRSVPVHVLSKSVRGAPAHGVRHLPRLRAWQRDRKVKREEGGEEKEQAAQPAPPAPPIPIMNHQRGGGLPLEVELRYSKTAAGSLSNHQASGGSNGSILAQLQAETQRTGAWTIHVIAQHSDDEQ